MAFERDTSQLFDHSDNSDTMAAEKASLVNHKKTSMKKIGAFKTGEIGGGLRGVWNRVPEDQLCLLF